MAKLSEFPAYAEAIRHIQLDQSIAGQEIDMDAEVPPYWKEPIAVAEYWLSAARDTAPAHVSGAVEVIGEYLNDPKEDSLLYYIAVPADDLDKKLLRLMGAGGLDFFCVRETLNAFFDGELRPVFEKIIPGSVAEEVNKIIGKLRR